MKIMRSDPDVLILDERFRLTGILLTLFILGVAGAGIAAALQQEYIVAVLCGLGVALGWVFTFVFIRRVQVIFDRKRNIIDIRCRTLRDQTRSSVPLSALRQAVLQVEEGDEGATYRIALDLEPGHHDGPLPLTCYFSSGLRDKEEAMAEINALVPGSQGAAAAQ